MLYSEQMKEILEKVGVNPDECKDGLYSTLLQAISDACGSGGGSGGGGGAEIKTCTVKFEPYSMSDGWETIEGAHYYGHHVYTKCVDGVISTVTEYGNSGTSYDITLENVVCGSLIWFDVNAETYDPSDLNGGEWLDNFTTLFIAPPEAGVVCTFRMGVPGESDW